jgi:predicted nucleotidyltransferase
VPNGGFRSKIEAMKMKTTGVLPGVSDLIIIKPNEILFIELKTDIGVQSKEQKEFQKRVELLGFSYYLVRSLQEFQQIVK